MNGKQGRHQRAAPDRSGHGAESYKDKNCVRSMEENTRQVVPSRSQTEQLAIEHVRHPGERMPVGNRHRCEGPSNVAPGQTLMNARILPDVSAVIIVNKFMLERLQVRQDR